MDDQFNPLQLWEAEKSLILYFYELNTYSALIGSGLEEYDQEDLEILAVDIDNTLNNRSSYFCLGMTESLEGPEDGQINDYITAIHHHIIQTQDINLATDIYEAAPLFAPIENFLDKHSTGKKSTFRSTTIIDIIKEPIYDIMSWAELWYIHHGQSIHDTLAGRSNTAYKIITRDPEADDSHIAAKDSMDSTKAFRSYFVKDFDAMKIATINRHMNDIGKPKKEGYVVKLAALTAVLYENKVLSKTYKATLTYLFDRFGIKEAPATYKPAQFKRPSMKGTVPAAWTEAVEYFNSL